LGDVGDLAMIKTRVEPLDKDIAVLLGDLSPAGRSAALASFARDALAEARQVNRNALGSEPRFDTFVDGREGAAIESVRPDGAIVFEFDLLRDLVIWIDAQLKRFSPVRTGRYRRSHAIFADGSQLDDPKALSRHAREIVFIPTVEYARRIEAGSSKQAPNGVYQAVAALARSRFGNIAKIAYTFRALDDVDLRDRRQPAIVLSL
jgi:hypothetical protein